MANPRITVKERNLIKGALRRVFSRSDLRKEALSKSIVHHIDTTRPRVKKWSRCPQCNQATPTYQMQVDHKLPIIPVDSKLEDMNFDEVIDRIWCVSNNLVAICKPCHIIKTSSENKERRLNKKKGKAA